MDKSNFQLELIAFSLI